MESNERAKEQRRADIFSNVLDYPGKCVFGILGEERRNLKRVTVILLRLYLTVIKKLLLVTFGVLRIVSILLRATSDIQSAVHSQFDVRAPISIG